MVILVTRPAPDNEKTAAALRARGFDALLSPMLQFEAVAFQDDGAAYDAVILTSANAVRAIENHTIKQRMIGIPAFAVGDHTADIARLAGFRNVISAKGEAVALRNLILESVSTRKLKKAARLCHLAGADLSRDIAKELGEHGLTGVTHTVYRMVPMSDFPTGVSEAFRAGQIAAMLHYSRRSARAFLAAARTAGVEISALALPQCCISDAVAGVLREAGATQVAAARTPDEEALLDALDRAVKPSSH